MSYVATYNAFQISSISKAEHHVLTAICTFADKNGICWPTTETIANRCRSSVRTVQTHIKGLVKAGLVQRIYRPNRPAITKVLIPVPATSSPLEVQLSHQEPVIPESVSIKTAHEQQHQHTTDGRAVSPQSFFIKTEQPEQPTDQAPQEQKDVHENAVNDCSATGTDLEQLTQTPAPAIPTMANAQGVPLEATGTPVEVTLAEVPANPITESPKAVEEDQDQAIAAWAEVPEDVKQSLEEIRRVKKKAPKPTRVEIKHWYSIALASGWSLPQIALCMVLNNWSKLNDASWLQHVPRPQMTATGAPAAPAAPKVWEPEPHTPASASTLAKMREQIAQMKARWREEPLKAPRPMRL